MEKGFIKYIVIIGVILGVVFLSQNWLPWGNAKTFGSAGENLLKAYSWAKAAVFNKIGGEVAKRGEEIKGKVEQEKEKVVEKATQNVGEKIKNYFSGIGESIIHPGTPQNCPAPADSKAAK